MGVGGVPFGRDYWSTQRLRFPVPQPDAPTSVLRRRSIPRLPPLQLRRQLLVNVHLVGQVVRHWCPVSGVRWEERWQREEPVNVTIITYSELFPPCSIHHYIHYLLTYLYLLTIDTLTTVLCCMFMLPIILRPACRITFCFHIIIFINNLMDKSYIEVFNSRSDNADAWNSRKQPLPFSNLHFEKWRIPLVYRSLVVWSKLEIASFSRESLDRLSYEVCYRKMAKCQMILPCMTVFSTSHSFS